MIAARPIIGVNPDAMRATPTISVDENGDYGGGPKAYALATAGVLAPTSGSVRGGDYIWACEATAWNGATATLQTLGQDGTTWRNMRNAANTADVTMTATGTVGIGAGQGSSFRVMLTGGAPANFYSNLAGLS